MRSSQQQLVDYLERGHWFTNKKVRSVLLAVDRADFAPRAPYLDTPQSIGYGATISAPHMHAQALQHLADVVSLPRARVLDVGSGSGYLAACFARMIGKGGKVVGVDHIPELVDESERNVRKHHADLLDKGRLELVTGDGRLGWTEHAPYQAIHVGAAALVLPPALIDQLAPGGRMLIPVGSYPQKFVKVEKLPNGELRKQELATVMYVPLTNRSHQLGDD